MSVDHNFFPLIIQVKNLGAILELFLYPHPLASSIANSLSSVFRMQPISLPFSSDTMVVQAIILLPVFGIAVIILFLPCLPVHSSLHLTAIKIIRSLLYSKIPKSFPISLGVKARHFKMVYRAFRPTLTKSC